ncbi:HAD-like domain-containing protein [Crassisporium funariophilum]|nr:HAD-like domain-containing protein [Crassisporium funariophilum]
MFSILTRSIPRRTLVQSPPVIPSSTGGNIKHTPPTPAPNADTPAPADTTGTLKPEEAATPLSSVPTLDFSPPEPSEGPQRTGAQSSKEFVSSNERRRGLMRRVALAMLVSAFAANTVYMGREWEEEELKAKKMRVEDAPSTRLDRTKERFIDLFDYFNKPAWPELLPPPYPPPHQKPYTLLISVDDLLVTSTWDRQHGWRTAKRPGVDYFLAYISQFYEVVVFTTQAYYTAGPVLDKLDRYNFYINYRLFREATRSLDGKVVKDLSYLNRDLSKVIALDTLPEHYATHPENAVILPKWNGDPHDKGLVAMIPFLESIAIYKPADVRPIVQAYQGKDVPLEYAKTEAEAKAKHVEEWKARNKSAKVGASFGSIFGISSAPAQPKNVPPPTYLEQKRKEAQIQYQEEQNYIKRNKDELEKLLEQDQQAMAAQVPGNLWEAMDQFKGKRPEDLAAPPPGSTQPSPPSGSEGGKV